MAIGSPLGLSSTVTSGIVSALDRPVTTGSADDFSYIDAIVDPNRAHRAGPKGYPPSAIFVVLLLMYLKEMKTILALVRFLNTHPELSLNLHRRPSLGRMVAVLKRLFSSPML